MTTTTRKRKTARERQRQRQQQMTVLIVIIIVAVVGAVLVAIANVPPSAPVTAATSDVYAGIPRGVSEEGLPQLGSPDAPVVIHDYSAFNCSHCANFHDNQFQELLDDIRSGRVRFVYVPVNLDSSTIPANKAAFCALAQDRFWELHDTFFSWLRQFGSNAFVMSRITAGVQEMGLDMDAFNACLNDPDTAQQVTAANELFDDLIARYSQVTGTPTLTFNGVPPEFGSGGPPMDYIRQRIAELSGG